MVFSLAAVILKGVKSLESFSAYTFLGYMKNVKLKYSQITIISYLDAILLVNQLIVH